MSSGRLMAIWTLFTAGAFAATPPLTTIQDILYKADGTRMNALAVITWNSFESADKSAIGMQTSTVPIVNGSLYVQLVPNTTANPSLPYTVTYSSDGKIQFQETWMVPPSSSPLRVRDVRTSSTTNVGTSGSSGGIVGSGGSGPVTEDNVTGLLADLAARPLKGPVYGAGRVALVDQNGTINTVVGNFNDCVYVNGTSGPCFDATQLPTYSDGETPTGVVDGSNANFGLKATPSPTQSLILFRNGMLQKQGFDYTLSGSAVRFSAGVAPQAGDTLMAWYRLPAAQGAPLAGGLSGDLSGLATVNPQVICGAAGTPTSAAALTTLGTCTIPASFVGSGDRLEVRFLFTHTGTGSAFSYALNWNGVAILQRTGGAADAMVSGKVDAAISAATTQIAGESFGTVLPLLPVLTTAAAVSSSTPLAITIQGGLATGGADSVQLANFTVIRYPAINNP